MYTPPYEIIVEFAKEDKSREKDPLYFEEAMDVCIFGRYPRLYSPSEGWGSLFFICCNNYPWTFQLLVMKTGYKTLSPSAKVCTQPARRRSEATGKRTRTRKS
jgi:hypothetical protein